MIEEMAKDMLEYGMEKYPTSDSVFTETKLREQFYKVFLAYAEHLVQKGYCKIHEGAVALTIDEMDGIIKRAYDFGVEAGAEKFAKMAKERCEERSRSYGYNTWVNGVKHEVATGYVEGKIDQNDINKIRNEIIGETK